ncbi:MAG: hypothetical protein KAY46_26445 [Burkholderiaceae bacterium]|nr:hypothetical protein [Burkholderiaceae bacterium]
MSIDPQTYVDRLRAATIRLVTAANEVTAKSDITEADLEELNAASVAASDLAANPPKVPE